MSLLTCLFALAVLISCGDGGVDREYRKAEPAPQKPKPTQPTAPTDDEGEPTPPIVDEGPSAEDLQLLAVVGVQKNCATCHGGSQPPSLVGEREILSKVDRICARVGSGTMPPGGGIAAGDKSAILEGFGCL